MQKKSKLIITCGGTGGHFYPGLTIAKEYKEQGNEVELFINGKNADSQAQIAKDNGLNSIIVPSAQIPKSIWGYLPFCIEILSGIMIARKEFKRFRPNVFLGMGSFTAVPSALAAKLMGIPIVLHDGNAKIGKANRILSRISKVLLTAFPPVNSKAIHCKLKHLGMPVRKELLDKNISKSEAIEELNSKFKVQFNAEEPIVLVFGGSQGAKTFNENIPKSIKKLDRPPQVIHLTGIGKKYTTKDSYSDNLFNLLLLETSNEMSLFYTLADLIICRAGGSSIAEVALFAKYALLIPYPYAAELHQEDNAAYLASSEGASVIKDKQCTEEVLIPFLSDWLLNIDKFNKLGKKSAKCASPNATYEIIEIINEI